VAGKKYIIVYEAGPALFGEFSEKDYGISVTDGVEINNSEVDIAGLAVSKFTLSGEEGAWQLSTGGKYMAWTSGTRLKRKILLMTKAQLGLSPRPMTDIS